MSLPPSADDPSGGPVPAPAMEPPPLPLLSSRWEMRPLLLWVATLPQVVLLLLNLRAFRLIASELTAAQHTLAWSVFAMELGLLAGATAVALAGKGRRLTWAVSVPLLVLAIAYLWLTFAELGGLIPSALQSWALPADTQIYYQFIFVMPLIFHLGVWMSTRPTRLSSRQEGLLLVGLIIGVPLFALGLFYLTVSILPYSVHLPAAVYTTICVLCSLAVLGALVRACVRGFAAVRRTGPRAHGVAVFLVALAAPLGGLWLNHSIPFPHDFQAWPVYALAVLNGGLLLLPRGQSPGAQRRAWLAQCALFPFTLYFFLVFLPYLPLSFGAMALYGAGFLMLAPTALFFLHGQRLLEGYRQERARRRPWWVNLQLASALSLLPALYVAETIADRLVLRRALTHVYTPVYANLERFSGSAALVCHSLEHLRDFKAGVHLPFLAEVYQWAVFDNLVLPDDKIHALYHIFSGRELPPPRTETFSLFQDDSGRGRPRESTRSSAPPSTAQLVNMTAMTKVDGLSERTNFLLDVVGTGAGENEFATEIKLPEGVFVTGLWLTIGQERKPARAYEKETALWVYQQISRVARCDPALLTYRDLHTLDLKVFPVRNLEHRTVEVEIGYPAGLHPAVTIGDREWRGEGDGPRAFSAVTSNFGGALALTAEAAAGLPRAARAPYLHFIVDRSRASKLDAGQIKAALQRAAAHFPVAHDCRVTAVNFEFADLSRELTPLAGLDQGALARLLGQRGGFMAEAALKRGLSKYQWDFHRATPESPAFHLYPVFILLGCEPESVQVSDSLIHFQRLAAEAGAFYATPDGTTLQAIDFTGQRLGQDVVPPHPTALLQWGTGLAACPLDAGAVVVNFAPSGGNTHLTVLDGPAFRPYEATELDREHLFTKGAAGAQEVLRMNFETWPDETVRFDQVQTSRDSGILLDGAALIIVENSAQQEMLERKQKQKLRNIDALEFEETPEPTSALLLLTGAALLGGRRLRWRENQT